MARRGRHVQGLERPRADRSRFGQSVPGLKTLDGGRYACVEPSRRPCGAVEIAFDDQPLPQCRDQRPLVARFEHGAGRQDGPAALLGDALVDPRRAHRVHERARVEGRARVLRDRDLGGSRGRWLRARDRRRRCGRRTRGWGALGGRRRRGPRFERSRRSFNARRRRRGRRRGRGPLRRRQAAPQGPREKNA